MTEMAKRARTEASPEPPAGTAFRIWLNWNGLEDDVVHIGPNQELTNGQRADVTRVEAIEADTIPSLFFKNCPQLKSFTVGADNCLTAIRDGAFQGCPMLCKVDFPETLLDIDGWAFEDSPLLTGTLPAGLRFVCATTFHPRVDVSEMFPHVRLTLLCDDTTHRLIWSASTSNVNPNPTHCALLLKMKAHRLGASVVRNVTWKHDGPTVCMSGTISSACGILP